MNGMHYKRGIVARQAHVGIPDGTVEEEYARRGFFGRTSHLYRKNPPVGWTALEGDLRPHALHVSDMDPVDAGDQLVHRPVFLQNADCKLSLCKLDRAMDTLFRNADGDDLLFVHAGTGRIETDFGPLGYEPGDYLLIPRGTTYRLLPAEASTFLVVETTDELELPDRGMLGPHAQFDLNVIEVPTPAEPTTDGRDSWTVVVKRQDKLSRITYPYHPLDVVGWKGDLTVWKLNVRDIRPVMSERYHLPPSAHTTFLTPGVIICTFLPRALETGDPDALRVPFYHSNIDFDEVLFYHAGDFFSREGIDAGMVTFHPQGIHHGPQPGAVRAVEGKTHTNEIAVMVDTRRPLELTELGQSVSRADYWKSWQDPSA